jgi:hypothetical protein
MSKFQTVESSLSVTLECQQGGLLSDMVDAANFILRDANYESESAQELNNRVVLAMYTAVLAGLADLPKTVEIYEYSQN